jgi:hypothetical protein
MLTLVFLNRIGTCINFWRSFRHLLQVNISRTTISLSMLLKPC